MRRLLHVAPTDTPTSCASVVVYCLHMTQNKYFDFETVKKKTTNSPSLWEAITLSYVTCCRINDKIVHFKIPKLVICTTLFEQPYRLSVATDSADFLNPRNGNKKFEFDPGSIQNLIWYAVTAFYNPLHRFILNEGSLYPVFI